MKFKKLINIVKWFWVAAVLAGAGYYLFRNFGQISSYLKTVSVWRMLVSFLLIVLGKLILADFTRLSLRRIGYSINFPDAVNISGMTQLGKYLPGGVWQFASKLGVYKVRGIDLGRAGKAMILENFWLLSSALAYGIFFISVFGRDTICQFNASFCDLHVLNIVTILTPIAWIGGECIFEKVLFRKQKIDRRDFLTAQIEQFFIWMISSFSFFILFGSQAGLSDFGRIIGVFNLSWAAGFIAFFAPGGLGVRELFLTVLLSPVISEELVLIYASLHRILWFAADLAVGFGSSALFGITLNQDNE